ncbi:MAG TPA: winged helix DNA-binding domain-containing protein [Puia sp.]|nr:winged helix DNA-binding domain-containing protein [Puia sp.]
MQTTGTITREDITRRRMANQQVSAGGFMRPESLVAWLGCVQAQDFGAAKWAVGSRLNGASGDGIPGGSEPWTDTGVQRAFNEGKILRTHILRPTWHFVAPADIRWMLALTAPRIKTFCAGMHRQLELDQAIFRRSNAILQKTLADGVQLTRKELLPVFQRAKIRTDELRLAHLLMQAELDGVICSGAMSGKQFTYALMDDRAPDGKLLQPEEAVAELVLRYFKSRGPATLADFAWWSGLTVADGRKGVEALRSQFINEVADGQSYWIHSGSPSSAANPIPANQPGQQALHVLPAFDEYTVAYKDRDLVLSPKHAMRSGNGIFKPILLCEGQIAGTWQRTIHKDHVAVTIDLFRPLGRKPVKAAFAAYADFMEKRVVCHFG